MKEEQVPQNESILAGYRRAWYAEGADGRYRIVPSRGWDMEGAVNALAHEQLDRETEDARREVIEGTASPLKYHMKKQQMTPELLAAYAGIATFRVRRHLKARTFEKLSLKTLERYATALALSPEDLRTVPEPS